MRVSQAVPTILAVAVAVVMSGCFAMRGERLTTGESEVRITNERDTAIVVSIPGIASKETVLSRTRWWTIDPSGSGPDVYARVGGQVTVYSTACEIIGQLVLAYGNESNTVRQDGSIAADPPSLGELKPIWGTTEISGPDPCPNPSPHRPT
jgi:hypothetical protein